MIVSHGRRAGSWKLPRQGAIALFNHDIHPFRIHDLARNPEFLSELQFSFGYHPHSPTLGESIIRPSFIMSDPERGQALEDYKKSLLELREWEAKLKTLRLGIKDLQREFDVSEDNIKALQSVGQIIGEVLKQLDEERCKYLKLKLFASMIASRS